jgi:two-component system response regulator DegU
MDSTTPIKVAIIDDRPKARKKLVQLVGKDPGLQMVAATDTGPAGIHALEEQKPDVILLDIKEPFSDSMETTSMFIGKFPDTRVILLSRHSKKSISASFCEKWACFFLCDDCSAKGILSAIREGHHHGGAEVSPPAGV